MTTWDNWLRPWAEIRWLLLIGLICLALNAALLIGGRTISDRGPLLDLQLGYSPQQAHAFLAAIDGSGRQLYLWLLLSIDLIYPPAYALLLSLLLIKTDPLQQQSNWLVLPIIAAGCDWCENLGLAALLVSFQRDQPSQLAWFTMVCTLLKWLAVTLCLLAIPVSVWLSWRRSVDRTLPR